MGAVSYTHLDVYKRQLEHCSRCGKPFAPHKEIDYAKRLLQKAGGMEAEQAARTVGMCQECKRELDALRAASAVKTGNAHGMACLLYTSRCV